MPTVTATLYTRTGCGLCDEALELLERHGVDVRCHDIDQDPLLRARYGDCVPVVVIDHKERFRGRVHPLLLKRLLFARKLLSPWKHWGCSPSSGSPDGS